MATTTTIIVGEVDIKVTRIGKRWHARLLRGAKVLDEMACASRADIGWICREMMRWYDKLGGTSKHAAAARNRATGEKPQGKVWYRQQLQKATA